MEMYNPPHPGIILREEVLKPLKLSVTKAALMLGISRKVLSDIINEKAGISPAMSLKLGKSLGSSPDFWLKLQSAYDLWRAKQSTNLDNVQIIQKSA
jgi:antitoxin HigA-1